MIDIPLWSFPIFAGVLMYAMHLIVMWRLEASERRWRRDKAAHHAAE